MSTRTSLISAIVDHVATAGTCPAAKLAAARWHRHQPILAAYGSPAVLAAAGRAVCNRDQDHLLTAVLDVAAGDEWAQLTILAILAPRLRWIVNGWARQPDARTDLADLEAQLVTEVLAAIVATAGGPEPQCPGLVLVDRAWVRVRDRRIKDRRRSERQVPFDPARPPNPPMATTGQSDAIALAEAVTHAVRQGTVGLGPARALYLSRVVGLTTAETAAALDTNPDVVRALRSRAAGRLVEAA
jgi:hypothetical protein